MPLDPTSGVHFSLHGQGQPLILGFPIMASHSNIFGAVQASVLSGFLDRLTDRYRVLVMDYPSIGLSASIPPAELTAERVCADILSVADAAGFDRFAWWGYAFGGAVGLQLATRTDRLSALVVGGWSPLDAPYPAMLQAVRANVDDPPSSSRMVLREPAQYAQWATFWDSLQSWAETEAEAVRGIQCPRLAIAGVAGEVISGGVDIGYAAALVSNRPALQAMGWQVEIMEDHGHEVGLNPAVFVPQVRAFLDAALPRMTDA